MKPVRKFRMEKLVRDKMAEKFQKRGGRLKLRTLTPQDFQIQLLEKLKEEVAEVIHSVTQEELCEEMADLLEVMRALANMKQIPWRDIELMRLEKKKTKGGFEKAIFAEFVELDSKDHPGIDYCLKHPQKYPEVFDF